MNKYLITLALAIISCEAGSQIRWNAGAGLYTQSLRTPGALMEMERERFFVPEMSFRTVAGAACYTTNDYNAWMIDVRSGFRKYNDKGWYFEHTAGLGLISTHYKVDGIFYKDKYGHVIRFKEGANFSPMISLSAGGGFDFTRHRIRSNMLWFRTGFHWNFGIRGLNQPFFGFQIGYSRTIKYKHNES